MFLLLFALSIALSVFCIKKFKECDPYDTSDGFASAFFSVTASVIFFGLVCFLVVQVGTGYIIDEKIEMYEEQNASIEERIDTVVKEYMEFETTTYIDLKEKDAITLVSLFPDLKSDTLVSKEIEVYLQNNEKIAELKEKKIDLSMIRFILYFGK